MASFFPRSDPPGAHHPLIDLGMGAGVVITLYLTLKDVVATVSTSLAAGLPAGPVDVGTPFPLPSPWFIAAIVLLTALVWILPMPLKGEMP